METNPEKLNTIIELFRTIINRPRTFWALIFLSFSLCVIYIFKDTIITYLAKPLPYSNKAEVETIACWNKYQSILELNDKVIRGYVKSNQDPNLEVILAHNETVIIQLKELNKESDVDTQLSEHILNHVKIGEGQLTWLLDCQSNSRANVELTKKLMMRGHSIKSDLETLLSNEKQLAALLKERYKKTFFIKHMGTGFL